MLEIPNDLLDFSDESWLFISLLCFPILYRNALVIILRVLLKYQCWELKKELPVKCIQVIPWQID